MSNTIVFFIVLSSCWFGSPILTGTFGPEFGSEVEHKCKLDKNQLVFTLFSKILAGKLSKLTVLAICWKIDTYRGRCVIPCSVGGKPNTNTHTAELFQISVL